MAEANVPLILCVDDDPDWLKLIERFLQKGGYSAILADQGQKALQILQKARPDLILLDINMREMDGYEFCAELQKREEWAYIPIVFLTASSDEQNKARAFSLGAVDYITKPTSQDHLNAIVAKHLKTGSRWEEIRGGQQLVKEQEFQPDFSQFKAFWVNRLSLPEEKVAKINQISPLRIYEIPVDVGISSRQMARLISEFLELEYASLISPDRVQLGVLPVAYCKKKLVVPLKDSAADQTFALSNPFDWELLDILKRYSNGKVMKLIITEPENIESLLENEATIGKVIVEAQKEPRPPSKEMLKRDIEKHPVVYLANSILDTAVFERASDIHVEPKEEKTVVRFRVDGDLRDFCTLEKNTGTMLISRLKALSGLDITEKRKPQDGAFAATIGNRYFKLRLATTSTPHGESIVIRMLEPSVRPKELQELGMTAGQIEKMKNFANKTHGLLLFVGPTGSGKTTTIYSFLSKIDSHRRSLMSVEDPVEYRIPFANQQQVNEKAGVTFEVLVKSAVRQDPDILFLGEVRDPYSARMSMDFASTGHLTVTTLHTSNATTAIFRLERLGISREILAEALLGIIAQRLIKKLCPYCKKVVKITPKEQETLQPFTNEVPSKVAHGVGCPKCNNTGYHGREGVYEVIEFDDQVTGMARSGAPISEIRGFVRQRGDYLISHHAVEKVKDLLFSPEDAYEDMLSEEIFPGRKLSREEPAPVGISPKMTAEETSVLLVDDDPDVQKLIARYLKNQGYRVNAAQDGIEALMNLARGNFDLIISDINMPNLDGFKLLEIMQQKGMDTTPVILLTGSSGPEDELRGFELGAVDYIKKPIHKELLLLRVKNALGKRPKGRVLTGEVLGIT